MGQDLGPEVRGQPRKEPSPLHCDCTGAPAAVHMGRAVVHRGFLQALGPRGRSDFPYELVIPSAAASVTFASHDSTVGDMSAPGGP